MKRLIILTFFMVTIISFGQKRKDREGNIQNLNGITEYNLVFDYENIKVYKFKTEEDFLKYEIDKREKKNAGDGAKFKKDWFEDREKRYEPKFILSFNKRFKDGLVKVEKKSTTATHTMKVKTNWIFTGYNAGTTRLASKLNATILIYETANPENIIFSTDYTKVPGSGPLGVDFNSGYRISECYAKLAKEFVKYIKRKTTYQKS